VDVKAFASNKLIWSKTVPEIATLYKKHHCNFPAHKSIVVATDNAFTVVSWEGQVSAPQRVVVGGLPRKIVAMTTHGDTIIVAIADGRVCFYSRGKPFYLAGSNSYTEIVSLANLSANKVIVTSSPQRINELLKKVPSDVGVQLKDAYLQYK
jgi:hypothetical protein